MATEALQIDALWSGLFSPVNGKAYSGAIVATYATDGSTPKAIWENKEKTQPSALGKFQVILDSVGAAEVFGDGVYVIKVYAPTDTLLTNPLRTLDGLSYIISVDPSNEGYDSIADMRAGTGGAFDGFIKNVFGNDDKEENRDWQFRWNATSTEADDGIYIIKVTSITTGRWERLGADSIIYSIPTDYLTLQDAIDDVTASDVVSAIINIETGHELTAGLRCANGNFNNVSITSDDATVTLDAGFVAAVPEAGDIVNTSGYSATMVILGFNAVLPELRCLIDMDGFVADGMNIGSGASALIADGFGIINAGERGLVCWSNSNVSGRGSVWTGAYDEGIRIQGGCKADMRNSVTNGCMLNPIIGEAAIYVSRSSIAEFRGATATGSGSDALQVRRSIVTAVDMDISNANQLGDGEACLNAESLALVDASGSFTANGGKRGLWVQAGAKVNIGGEVKDNTSSDIYIASGGIITGDCITTNSGGVLPMNAADMSGDFTNFNQFSYGGLVLNSNHPDAIVKGSSGNHVWYKYSDGRMEYHVNADIIVTGTITSGNFSGQLAKPTLVETFIDIHSTQMEAIGKTEAGGGGSRVGVYTIGRNAVTTDPFKIYNTGVQTDGVSTGLSVESVQVQWTIFGTWK